MSRHEVTAQQIIDYVSGAASTREGEKLEFHFARCPSCAAELHHMQALTAGLAHMSGAEVTSQSIARWTVVSQAHRREILEKRRSAVLILLLSFMVGMLFVISIPALSTVTELLGNRLNWPPMLTLLCGLLVWGSMCGSVTVALIPLVLNRASHWKEKWL